MLKTYTKISMKFSDARFFWLSRLFDMLADVWDLNIAFAIPANLEREIYVLQAIMKFADQVENVLNVVESWWAMLWVDSGLKIWAMDDEMNGTFALSALAFFERNRISLMVLRSWWNEMI